MIHEYDPEGFAQKIYFEIDATLPELNPVEACALAVTCITLLFMTSAADDAVAPELYPFGGQSPLPAECIRTIDVGNEDPRGDVLAHVDEWMQHGRPHIGLCILLTYTEPHRAAWLWTFGCYRLMQFEAVQERFHSIYDQIKPGVPVQKVKTSYFRECLRHTLRYYVTNACPEELTRALLIEFLKIKLTPVANGPDKKLIPLRRGKLDWLDDIETRVDEPPNEEIIPIKRRVKRRNGYSGGVE